jgi:hypothetical protein
MQKKEDGWYPFIPLGLSFRERALLDGKNNLYELCVCLCEKRMLREYCVFCNEEDYQNLGYCSYGISVNVYFHFLVSSCIGPRL